MKNYKLILAYDGSRYKGWQRLGTGEKTIQDTLETAIQNTVTYPVHIQGSGRTDAGVHARGQVANMKIPFRLKENFQTQLNDLLPEDICVLSVEEVTGEFHARYSAVSKTYSFYVDTKEKADVFQWKYSYHFPWEIDLEKIRCGANYLEGLHDFTAFTDDKDEEKDKVRRIQSVSIKEKNGIIHFRYQGNGFLQHMVRIMTGTLLEIGRGDREPEDIERILKCKERAKAGFLVPAKGLFLDKVEY